MLKERQLHGKMSVEPAKSDTRQFANLPEVENCELWLCEMGEEPTNMINVRAATLKIECFTYYLVPPCSIKSTPPLTTPTNPPVCTTSLPPPLNLYSTSASPESHATRVCGGTSSFASSSPNAVSMSANARPLFALRMLTVLRQEVTSEDSKRVLRMS